MGISVNRDQVEGCEESNSCRTSVPSDSIAPPASPSELQRHPKDNRAKPHLNSTRTKSRVKSSSRRMFLDFSCSDVEEADDTEKTESRTRLKELSNSSGHQSKEAENRDNDNVQEPSLVHPHTTSENSWTCPLTLDELSLSPSDIEESVSPHPAHHTAGPANFQLVPKKCSGMILKLRRMFSDGLNRKKALYQAVSDSGTFTDPSLSQTKKGERVVCKERKSKQDLHRRTSKVTHRWQRTGSFSHALRPLCSSSKRKKKSLLKIKYCPYLSTCHSAEHKKRWVLRSAVQRARRAMRLSYPELVGKRIRHLYEEDDKSEVWYSGEVVRVHQANTDPLKTIFEVRYDSEPEWKYYLELLIDYKNGWLKIEE